MRTARRPAAAPCITPPAQRRPTARDDEGILLGMAILAMVILTIASAGAVLVVAADWRSTLYRDATAEAAAAAVSAEYLIDGLITAVGPRQAQATLQPSPTLVWRPVSGAWSPRSCVAEGCWTVEFNCAVHDARLLGLQLRSAASADCTTLGHGSEIQVWTVTVTAAAHCFPLPNGSSLADVRDVCQATAPPAELVYEPVALPFYSSIVGDGRIAARRTSSDPVYSAALAELGDDWEDLITVEDSFGNPVNDPVALSSTQTGLFFNEATGDVCQTDYSDREDEHASSQNVATAAGGEGCTVGGSGTGALELRNINGVPLTAARLQAGACGGSPDVVSWAAAGLPSTLPPGNRLKAHRVSGDVGDEAIDDLDPILGSSDVLIATGSVYIHQNINGDLSTGVKAIISGCHIFIVVPPSGTDTRTLSNVAIIAAGGVWASELAVDDASRNYIDNPPDLPRLNIEGSVVTGWAGQVSLTGHRLGDEIGIAGFVPCFYDVHDPAAPDCEDRALPNGWGSAVTKFWPGREYSSWRQR